MNREILFRGKHIHVLSQNKHLDGTWVYGYLCGKNYINSCDEDEYEEKFTSEILIDPETVCQYTGLTDKNGKKIFEGDIARDIFDCSVVGIVRYGEYQNVLDDDGFGGHVGFYIDWQEKKKWLRKDLAYWVKHSEFIGNIFDNCTGFLFKERSQLYWRF